MIRTCQIVTPIEWSFHTQGGIAQSLGYLAVSDKQELNTLANVLLDTIDPCTGCSPRVN